jgi:hypothetical protein
VVALLAGNVEQVKNALRAYARIRVRAHGVRHSRAPLDSLSVFNGLPGHLYRASLDASGHL